MVETGENQEIKKEIKEQTPSQNQDKEDVNFLIQKKCQENQIGEEEQKNITTFFKNIKNKLPKEYQNDLLDYIKNINGNDFSLLSMASDSEKVIEEKKIIDQIDLKQRKSIIDTYSEIEDKKSEIEDKKSEIEDKKSEIEGKKSEIETEEKIDEETKQLLEQAQKDYENLPNKYKLNKDNKEDQEKLKKQKEILEKDKTLNKLKDKGFSEDQINDYVSLNYTYSNHKEELKDTEFAKSYEKLENKLFPKRGIVKSEDFKGENAINTTNSIIDNNPKINNYVQQINGGSSNYQEKSKEIEKLNNNEIKEKFDKESNQKLFNKYKTLLPQEPKEDENKTTEENLQEKTKRQRNILLEINSLEEQTQSTIQKRVFGSTISGLTSFFDFSTGQKENLGENFEFSMEKGFDIDPVNNIFYLGGNIKENNINISYNLGNGNLSVEDHLFQTQDQNVLNFGKEKFQDLKIKLPPIQLLTNQARQISEKEVTAKNSQEYINNLEKNIHESLLLNFIGNQEIVKIRLERNIQKNLAAQETLSDFKNIISPENKNIYGNNFNKQEKPELFNLVKILDDSLENYTISESKEFRENIGTLTKFIQESTEKQGEQNIIGKFFRKLFKKQENKSTIETEEKNTKNLLDTIEKLSIQKEGKKIIDINLLKKTVLETQKAEPNLDKIPEPLSESITNPNPGKLLEQEGLRQDRPPTA